MGEIHKVDKIEYLITIDVDWGTDQDMWNMAKILIDNNTKATWFMTHNSPITRKICEYPDLFEVGIHPNFHEESTQGDTPSKVMEYLKEIVPNAQSVRTHRLIQSYDLLKMMRDEYGIMYDVSLFLPKTPHIIPHRFYFEMGKFITRIPYFWEDDAELVNPNKCFDLDNEKYSVGGLKIFNFHPIVTKESKPVNLFFRELAEFLQSKGKTIKEVGRELNVE